MQALQIGAVQMLAPSLAKLGPLGVREFEVFDLPFIVDSTADLHAMPIESMALKLFTGIEKSESMAIPFFILAGNFLTRGRVAKGMSRFATSLVGPWPGRAGRSSSPAIGR